MSAQTFHSRRVKNAKTHLLQTIKTPNRPRTQTAGTPETAVRLRALQFCAEFCTSEFHNRIMIATAKLHHRKSRGENCAVAHCGPFPALSFPIRKVKAGETSASGRSFWHLCRRDFDAFCFAIVCCDHEAVLSSLSFYP